MSSTPAETAENIWTCNMTPKQQPVTVGSLQDMVCHGEFTEKLDAKNLKIKFESKEHDYVLHILEAGALDHTSMSFVVTSYKAGKFQPPFVITDGIHSVQVKDLSWTVESVLANVQEKKPVPSKGPFALSMPWWVWTSLALGVLLLFTLVFLKIKKIWERKKLIEQLSHHSTALPPFHQFNKDLRSALRDWQQSEYKKHQGSEPFTRRDLLQSTEKMFRQYLMRELLIPTLEWSDAQILNELKRRHKKVFIELAPEIKKFLREVREAQKGEQKLSQIDCEQLVAMARKTSEKVYDLKTRGRR